VLERDFLDVIVAKQRRLMHPNSLANLQPGSNAALADASDGLDVRRVRPRISSGSAAGERHANDLRNLNNLSGSTAGTGEGADGFDLRKAKLRSIGF